MSGVRRGGESRPALVRRALLAKVHIGCKQLGLEDEAYRAWLRQLTGVASTRDLGDEALARVVAELVRLGARFTSPRRAGKPPSALGSGSDRAPLLGKIGALLADGGLPWAYAGAMAKRMYGKEALEFCGSAELVGIVTALVKRAAKQAGGG